MLPIIQIILTNTSLLGMKISDPTSSITELQKYFDSTLYPLVIVPIILSTSKEVAEEEHDDDFSSCHSVNI